MVCDQINKSKENIYDSETGVGRIKRNIVVVQITLFHTKLLKNVYTGEKLKCFSSICINRQINYNAI